MTTNNGRGTWFAALCLALGGFLAAGGFLWFYRIHSDSARALRAYALVTVWCAAAGFVGLGFWNARRRVQESERRHRTLLDALPDLVLRVRRDGMIVDSCGAAEAVWPHLPADRMAGRSLLDVLPRQTAEEALLLLGRALDTEQTQLHEYRLSERDDREFEARLIPQSSGETVVVVVRDVTEQQRAERALADAEAELRRIIGSISDCVWSAQADAGGAVQYRYIAPVSERITGRPPEFFSSPERWLEIVHPEDRSRLEQAAQRVASGQTSCERDEYRILLPDGAVRWIRSTVVGSRTADGRVRLDGIDSDITAHKAAEECLRQANEVLRAVIQASPLAIYRHDRDGNVLSWNPAAERMFGWREEEVLHRRLPFVPEEELEGFYGRLESGRRGNILTGFPARRRRKDGSPIDISIWTAPLRDARGNICGFLGIAADITEQKLLEEQLRQSQKMEAVGRLAGGVAHDFNNLLTVITGYSHMVLEDLDAADPLHRNVEEILKASERASALTNQLLAFSRRQLAQTRVVDLNELVRDMEDMLRRVIGEDIELTLALAPDLGTVRADPGQIQQIILNLAVNSRDAMPGGGRLEIRTANIDVDKSSCAPRLLEAPVRCVVLSVHDTGHGMDEQTRLRVFEPFFTTKEQGKGTGLGLSTVYGIVKQSGGEVLVSSERGSGATFEIYLPRLEEPAEAVQRADEDRSRLCGTETILLVEDEVGVRNLVREILTEYGYTILEAGGPEEALEICGRHPGRIQLLLTDLIMPQMSGRELAERLTERCRGLEVLYMSGYTGDPAVREMVGKPGIEFLQKPFTPVAVARKVRAVLDAGHRASRSATEGV